MSAVVLFDAVAAAGFLAALSFLYRLPARTADAQTKLFLGAALWIFLLVSGSNVLQYGGITEFFDRYEDYGKGLFVPLFLFGVYSLAGTWELGRRLATEAELRASRERYRTLVDNVDLGITLVATDYTVLMANAAQERLVRRPLGEILGQKCYRVFRHRDSACDDCPGAVCVRTGRSSTLDRDSERDDGSPFSVRIHAFPVPGADGHTEGFIEVVEDRTERVLAEKRRRELETQFLHAQKLESLGVLAGGIAHDFNNLLMGVLGNADLTLLRLPPETPARDYVKRIQAAAWRASELTSQLVAYSGRAVSDRKPLSLNELVDSTAALVEAAVSKKTLLHYQLAASRPAVDADETQLRQILMNLIINGSESLGGEAGVVAIRTGTAEVDRNYLLRCRLGEELPEGTYGYLEVEDNGCGMDKETAERIFDPFFSTKFAGRGLGLAAVLGIVRNHGGALYVESEPGKGSVFRVLLPALEGAALSAAEGAEPPIEPARVGKGRGTILVVDDEETVRSVCRMMLEEFGFSVRGAANGREALAVFERAPQEVSVVILDLAMPEMDGEETLRALRRSHADLPVILSSGYGEQEVFDRFQGLGYSAFIRKPYRCADLIDTVQQVLAEQAPRSPTAPNTEDKAQEPPPTFGDSAGDAGPTPSKE